MRTNYAQGSFKERLTQFVASYGDKKHSPTWESHKISGIIWGQQTHKEVYKSVSYNKEHHIATTNSEDSQEKRLIQFVESYANNKLRS